MPKYQRIQDEFDEIVGLSTESADDNISETAATTDTTCASSKHLNKTYINNNNNNSSNTNNNNQLIYNNSHSNEFSHYLENNSHAQQQHTKLPTSHSQHKQQQFDLLGNNLTNFPHHQAEPTAQSKPNDIGNTVTQQQQQQLNQHNFFNYALNNHHYHHADHDDEANDSDQQHMLHHHHHHAVDVDVPLLHGGCSSHDSDHSQHYHQQNNSGSNNNDNSLPSHSACRCGVPGFRANLKRQTDEDAKHKILFAILLCCAFMIIEFVGGYIAGSLAIMTDAAHLASDCIGFVISLVAIWLGSRAPSKRMSFGYKRMEVLGAIVSILGIWTLTATLVLVAMQRMFLNDYDLDANAMMTVSGIGIIINIVMFFILHGASFGVHGSHGHCHAHGHSHGFSSEQQRHASHAICTAADGTVAIGNGLKHGKITGSTNSTASNEKNINLRAAKIHVIGDFVQSIGVFLASILIKIYPNAKIADPLCTLLFSIIVIATTVPLFRESVGILMDAVPRNINLDDLEADLCNIEGVKNVHHLNVWNHTSDYGVLMVHLVIDFLSDSNKILEQATTLSCSSKYKLKHSTIQIERLSP